MERRNMREPFEPLGVDSVWRLVKTSPRQPRQGAAPKKGPRSRFPRPEITALVRCLPRGKPPAPPGGRPMAATQCSTGGPPAPTPIPIAGSAEGETPRDSHRHGRAAAPPRKMPPSRQARPTKNVGRLLPGPSRRRNPRDANACGPLSSQAVPRARQDWTTQHSAWSERHRGRRERPVLTNRDSGETLEPRSASLPLWVFFLPLRVTRSLTGRRTEKARLMCASDRAQREDTHSLRGRRSRN
jgi:hypothetical protein